MEDAEIIAELLGIKNPKIQKSCYAGMEICFYDEDGNYRIVTYVSSGNEFCYTKNCQGLNGDWKKVDYWFLYLK